jgi:hypothetical protein
MQEYHDAHRVARHLGVPRGDVVKWAHNPLDGFPMPDGWLHAGTSVNPTPIWRESKLRELRSWLASRLEVADPDIYWAKVDELGAPKVPDGQMEMLF